MHKQQYVPYIEGYIHASQHPTSLEDQTDSYLPALVRLIVEIATHTGTYREHVVMFGKRKAGVVRGMAMVKIKFAFTKIFH